MYAKVYQCDRCKDEKEIPADPHRDNSGIALGKCNCGGDYMPAGECYDQEFLDDEEYNRRQDEEYEERHRYDR